MRTFTFGRVNLSGQNPVSSQLRSKFVVLSAACALWSGWRCSEGIAEEKPRAKNVLFIMADDLNNHLGCYGHPLVRSPHIDHLAAKGVMFDRAYCNYPVCNPSRVSLMSGRHADRTGVVDNVTATRTYLKDATMLPEHFRNNGYVVRKVGKIFHTGDDYEDPRSWDIDIRENKTSKSPPMEQIFERDGHVIVLKVPDAETWDGYVATTAVEWLEELANQEKPFFVAAGFRRPHTPYITPATYYQWYDQAKLIPNFGPESHLAGIPPIALTYNFAKQERFPGGMKGAKIMAAYYGSVSFMDAQVGRLLDAVERLKLWESTAIVFVSDHGYHLGEHGGLWHKMTLFEDATRVPLIVAAPNAREHAVAKGIVELVDLYPTLCELTGLAPPAGLQGKSFVPQLQDADAAGKPYALSVASRGANHTAVLKLDPELMGRSLRSDRFRYTLWPDGKQELYDYSADRNEWTNLALNPDYSAVVAEHDRQLKDIVKAVGRP